MAVEMLRRLVVLRHAKSDWPDTPDHERPLAARGRRDAPAVGRWLRAEHCVPDRVVCSTAVRARETWELAAAELNAPAGVVYDERVYHASEPQLLLLVHELPDDDATALLVGHNPGLAGLVLTLAGTAEGDALDRARLKFPTAAVAVLAFTGPWHTLATGAARLTHFAAPRG
jgi:phosphohistidine phosphatase